MKTLPKLTYPQPEISTACDEDGFSVSTTQCNSDVYDYRVDGRNRKERRKAASQKRGKFRAPTQPQRKIENPFGTP